MTRLTLTGTALSKLLMLCTFPIDGSGDYDDTLYDEDYSEYDYETAYDDVEPAKKTPPLVPATAPTTSTSTTTSTTPTTPTTTTPATTTTAATTTSTQQSSIATTTLITPTHPHRHHHGEMLPEEDETNPFETSTTTTTKAAPTTTTTTTSGDGEKITTPKQPDFDDYDEYDYDTESETIVPEVSNKINATQAIYTSIENQPETGDDTGKTTTTSTRGEEEERVETTVDVVTTTEQTKHATDSGDFDFVPETTTVVTSQSAATTAQQQPEVEKTTTTIIDLTSATTEDQSTTMSDAAAAATTTAFKQTTPHVSSTPKTTTTRDITETIEEGMKNFPPSVSKRLKRIAVTAGKLFIYHIPRDTFMDMEDGYDLTLEFLDNEGREIKKNSWCQFNPRNREIYGLPLEEDVSGWEYIVRATDKEGASVNEHLIIHVQHHKSRRVVNHEISLYIHVEKRHEFPHNIDWSLKTLRALGTLYRSPNLTDITVRSVNYTSIPVVFTWTNDSLPKSYCPKADIEKIFGVSNSHDLRSTVSR